MDFNHRPPRCIHRNERTLNLVLYHWVTITTNTGFAIYAVNPANRRRLCFWCRTSSDFFAFGVHPTCRTSVTITHHRSWDIQQSRYKMCTQTNRFYPMVISYFMTFGSSTTFLGSHSPQPSSWLATPLPWNGHSRVRTDALSVMSRALSQLSYAPIVISLFPYKLFHHIKILQGE